jgi:hypothetical protein
MLHLPYLSFGTAQRSVTIAVALRRALFRTALVTPERLSTGRGSDLFLCGRRT